MMDLECFDHVHGQVMAEVTRPKDVFRDFLVNMLFTIRQIGSGILLRKKQIALGRRFVFYNGENRLTDKIFDRSKSFN